jgi:hypothetical protein
MSYGRMQRRHRFHRRTSSRCLCCRSRGSRTDPLIETARSPPTPPAPLQGLRKIQAPEALNLRRSRRVAADVLHGLMHKVPAVACEDSALHDVPCLRRRIVATHGLGDPPSAPVVCALHAERAVGERRGGRGDKPVLGVVCVEPVAVGCSTPLGGTANLGAAKATEEMRIRKQHRQQEPTY